MTINARVTLSAMWTFAIMATIGAASFVVQDCTAQQGIQAIAPSAEAVACVAVCIATKMPADAILRKCGPDVADILKALESSKDPNAVAVTAYMRAKP